MLNPPKTPQRRMNFRRANRCMPKRRFDIPTHEIDFKNTELLKKFTTEAGKILSRRTTGVATHIHRKITSAIKRARSVLLMK